MKIRSGINMVCFCLCIGFVIACDKDDDDEPSMPEKDRTFVMNAAHANQAEIEFGRLAASKGEHEAVRDFGNQMVNDHQTALNDLETLAAGWNLELPQGLDSMHQVKWQMLSGMSGYSFDTAYITSQIMDHNTAIALFEDQSRNGQVQRVKDYANKYLPHLRMHREKIDSVNNVVR
ncbi:MAG: DUF4142 domain-containing protein [Pseudobacter sp.]|uniref:DUF4142 domain-containing protein n=1 Tax=Pseudobacter sp. TaxID=2045420 RepID=UPI003F809449